MKTFILFCLILSICYTQTPPSSSSSSSSSSSICPNGNLHTDMFSGQVTFGQISSQPNIILATGKDLYNYTYNLPLPFRKIPSVAISINTIQSSYSSNFDFHVRYISNDNKQNLTFIIKIDHKTSSWIKFSYNFLAQIRDDIIIGNYILTPNYLTLTQINKNQSYFVSFLQKINPQFQDSKILIYINGFDLYSRESSSGLGSSQDNQFEIKIQNIKSNQNGIKFNIISNTTTQIQKIYISIIMISNKSMLQVISFINQTTVSNGYGQSRYNIYASVGGSSSVNTNTTSSNTTTNTTATPTDPIKATDLPKYKSLYGLSSFSIQNLQSQSRNYDILINPIQSQIIISTGTYKFNYLSNNFLFLRSQQCSGCLSYNLYDPKSNKCVSTCPTNSYPIFGQCKQCPGSSHWNGFKCVSCAPNQQWNSSLTTCNCINGYYRILGVCEKCPSGTVFNSKTSKCQCQIQGQYYDLFSQRCICQPQFYIINGICQKCQIGSYWDGYTCVIFNPCAQYPYTKYNPNTQICQCLQNFIQYAPNSCYCNGYIDMVGNCQQCLLQNTVWSGKQCVCKGGYRKNNVGECVVEITSCPQGQYVDTVNNVCVACGEGCKQCDRSRCIGCYYGYGLVANSQSCNQICGDGYKIKHACDDGNTLNGDGCSSTCLIQSNYTCTYDNIKLKDICTPINPAPLVEVITIGQPIRSDKTFIMGVKLNYLPSTLVQNGVCTLCGSLFTVRTSNGLVFKSDIKYNSGGIVPSFSLMITFDVVPMSNFQVALKINTDLSVYFGSVDISQVAIKNVDLAVLSTRTQLKGTGQTDNLK